MLLPAAQILSVKLSAHDCTCTLLLATILSHCPLPPRPLVRIGQSTRTTQAEDRRKLYHYTTCLPLSSPSPRAQLCNRSCIPATLIVGSCEYDTNVSDSSVVSSDSSVVSSDSSVVSSDSSVVSSDSSVFPYPCHSSSVTSGLSYRSVAPPLLPPSNDTNVKGDMHAMP